MASRFEYTVLGVIILIALVSTVSVIQEGSGTSDGSSVSGYFSALRFRCAINVYMDAAEEIILYPNSNGELVVTIHDVSCGVTGARLSLEDIPARLYTVEPAMISSIAPLKEYEYLVKFSIPASEETTTYTGQYVLTTEENIFRFHSIDVRVEEQPEKPAVKIIPRKTVVVETTKTAPDRNPNSTFVVAFISTLSALILATHLFFSKPHKMAQHPKSKKTLKTVISSKRKGSRKP